MIISDFEVWVTSPEGVPFYEVLDPSTGQLYVVAEAGKRFELRYRKISPYWSLPSTNRYTIRAKIDGKCVGTGQSMMPGKNEARHVGFLRHGDTQGITYDLFKFASATADEAVLADSLDFQQGKIVVAVQEIRELPEKNMHSSYGDSSQTKVPSLPDGKKFFLAPSLTTASAGVHINPSGFSTLKFVDVGPPVAKFHFRYETPSTLLLRKILRPENPGHAAILNSFPETRVSVPNTRPSTSVMASSATAQQQHPRVKRERTIIKTEVIDLAGSSIRIAENLAPNEELTCDLTADEEAPRWVKRRKDAPEEEINKNEDSTQ